MDAFQKYLPIESLSMKKLGQIKGKIESRKIIIKLRQVQGKNHG